MASPIIEATLVFHKPGPSQYTNAAAVWAQEAENRFKKQASERWRKDAKFRLEQRRAILAEAVAMIPKFGAVEELPNDAKKKESKSLSVSEYAEHRGKFLLAENRRVLDRIQEGELTDPDEIDDRLATLEVFYLRAVGEMRRSYESARDVLEGLKRTRLQRLLNLGDEDEADPEQDEPLPITAERVPPIDSVNTNTKGYTDEPEPQPEESESMPVFAQKKGYAYVPPTSSPDQPLLDAGEDPNMGEWALFWAIEKEVPVFPVWGSFDGICFCPLGESCEHAGKHPMGNLAPKGVDDATTDPERIRAWWRKAPHANIGGAMGGAARRLGVDVDPRAGGLESLHGIFEEDGEWPVTLQNRSGGGGPHFFFRLPEGFTFKKGKLAPGIDLKYSGGYLILPPSMHKSGSRYIVEEAAPEGESPQSLLDRLAQPKMPSNVVSIARDRYSVFVNPAHRDFSNGRNNELFRIGKGRWMNGWHSDLTDLHAYLAEQNALCADPLEGGEVAKLAAHIAHDYAQGEPRDRQRGRTV